jgi:hypothetical protein
MLGGTVDYRPPVFFNSAKFFAIEYTVVGATAKLPPGATSFYYRAAGRDASVRIVSHAGAVIGFNLLGARWNHAVLEGWIAARLGRDQVVARLHEAQFDGEFGRLDLAPLRREYAAWSTRQPE